MFSKGKSYWSARRANMAKADIYIADMPYDVADFEGEAFVDSGTADPSLYLPVNSSPEINEPGELHGVGLLMTVSDDDADSDSDGVSSADSIRSDEELAQLLARWKIENNISMTAFGSLLRLLHLYHPSLPLDPRTLLETPRSVAVKEISGGSYYHIGIGHNIQKLYVAGKLDASCLCSGVLSLQVNIDGIPIYKSSGYQLWPILGIIKGGESIEKPFTIGIYAGLKKPQNVEEFLEDFVQEAKQLESQCITVGNNEIRVIIHSIICDAPARSLLKNVKLHSGYSACERCCQSGEWHGKVVYPNVDAPLRTDVAFDEMIDDEHHRGPSPLRVLNIGLVSQFCLDYMHLICLGVMRRLILYWLRGPLITRISSSSVSRMSEYLLQLRQFIPREFARKPRPMIEVDRWKATEFPQFLLYTGPLVLKSILHESVYQHFMLLSVATYICVSPQLSEHYLGYAHELLLMFVQQASVLYGMGFVVYNVHSLSHVVDDVKRFGVLDNISAFPFENHLRYLKKLVKRPSLPLNQIVSRIAEQDHFVVSGKLLPRDMMQLCGEHHFGPLPHGIQSAAVTQYQMLKLKQFVIRRTTSNDSCFVFNSGDIGLVRNIVKKDGEIYVVYQSFEKQNVFFDYPCPSANLGIFLVNKLCNNCQIAKYCNIVKKCVCMKIGDDGSGYVCVPLAHVEQ